MPEKHNTETLYYKEMPEFLTLSNGIQTYIEFPFFESPGLPNQKLLNAVIVALLFR